MAHASRLGQKEREREERTMVITMAKLRMVHASRLGQYRDVEMYCYISHQIFAVSYYYVVCTKSRHHYILSPVAAFVTISYNWSQITHH